MPFASFSHHDPSGSESRFAGASARRCAREYPSLPQGSLAPGRVLLSRPLIAYYDPIRQSRGHATTSRQSRLYVTPSLCGHASATRETFPTFTAALSARAIDHTPAGLRNPSRCLALRSTRLPRVLTESPPTTPSLPAIPDGGSNFGAASFALCYGPCVCLALLTGYETDGITCVPPVPSEGFVVPAFRAGRHRPTLGIWLDGRTGNLPSSGLAPDKSQQLVRLQQNQEPITSPD
jgi:hypothetical protein